ncbi:hypothetical protein GCM10007198_25410 [Microbacterium aerolatum]|uniref:Uncharacterized protein n=2 Tax=Microbacterium aerolatum TaxID=153731 RepID=A0A511AHW8_9MICO|nr:hypothetical protein MAE01_29050 [Microbacterium aerolatum]GGB33793.1 hypothetical protein GCM10007198_25410 [Microbacterium aerolatum]
MRDIIRLFADRESRDELGVGQIRDALGDALFPGTSTLHTRARYLLFIPWIFQKASGRPNPSSDADRMERKLINAIRDSDDYAGLLGLQAGANLKTLPSSIYWSMLRRFRILRDPALTAQNVLTLDGRAVGGDDIDEGSGGRFRAWSTTMPGAPNGFPDAVPGGFMLSREEAGWLRDRILDEVPGTLLAHFTVNRPAPDSPAPWADAAALSVTGESRALLDHAHSFSAVMHGAQLLYNLLLAEQYEQGGFQSESGRSDRYRSEVDRWAETLPAIVDVATWDLDDLLRRVDIVRGAPIHPRSARFVRDWRDLLRRIPTSDVADHPETREFIAARERQNKGPQARLGNPRRLQTWGGGSGAGALVFRWPNVRGILNDIHDGLDRVPEADVA